MPFLTQTSFHLQEEKCPQVLFEGVPKFLGKRHLEVTQSSAPWTGGLRVPESRVF